ncbi:MAG: phosphopentomutase [Desulfobacteraceae bacterium]|nr:phosphopentomutase [Desulfobacteraceae bacterium]
MKAILLIIDSFGVGALPDAHIYGDEGANTALHICEEIPQKKWHSLQKLGFGNCVNLLGVKLPGCEPSHNPIASYGVMNQMSAGKDTTTGHWELSGIILDKPFQTFPQAYPSFPEPLVNDFQELSGYKILGNKGASGTVIIEELGQAHMEGEGMIIYTSADSVFQIAVHEEIVPVKKLYSICEGTRKLCDPYHVGRVIARPFIGIPGHFKRTSARKDFSMPPPANTILDHLKKNSIQTIGIGKIGDIFSEQGIDMSFHDAGNKACLARTLDCMNKNKNKDQFLFINLVDTDMLYGHRRDIKGYYDALEVIDGTLPKIMELMSKKDLLIITADHGCDPGFKGTDHTREYVPLLVYQKGVETNNLGIRKSFCDVAQSLASFFDALSMANGKSFIN